MAKLGWWVLNGLVALLLAVSFLGSYAGGAIAAYVLIALSLALVIWNLFRPSAVAPDPGAWFFVGSFALIALAFAITNQPGRTDFLFATNFAMFALFPLLSNALQRFAGRRNLLIVAILACAGALLAFAIALIEVKIFDFNQGRATGLSTNPIPSSTAALLMGFFALAGFFAVSRRWRYLFLLGPIAGIGTVYLSGSRGPLLALPALLIIAVVMVPVRRTIALSIAAVGVVAAVAVFVFRPSLLGRIGLLPAMLGDLLSGRPIATNLDVGGSIRSSILQGSIAAFEHAPWLGYGWYMKVPAVEKYLPWDVHFGDPIHAHLHSDILNFAVAAGVVGLIAYALVLLAPIVGAATSVRDAQYWGRLYLSLILSAGFACCGAVNLLFGFEYMTTLYVVFAAIFLGYCRDGVRPVAA